MQQRRLRVWHCAHWTLSPHPARCQSLAPVWNRTVEVVAVEIAAASPAAHAGAVGGYARHSAAAGAPVRAGGIGIHTGWGKGAGRGHKGGETVATRAFGCMLGSRAGGLLSTQAGGQERARMQGRGSRWAIWVWCDGGAARGVRGTSSGAAHAGWGHVGSQAGAGRGRVTGTTWMCMRAVGTQSWGFLKAVLADVHLGAPMSPCRLVAEQ